MLTKKRLLIGSIIIAFLVLSAAVLFGIQSVNATTTDAGNKAITNLGFVQEAGEIDTDGDGVPDSPSLEGQVTVPTKIIGVIKAKTGDIVYPTNLEAQNESAFPVHVSALDYAPESDMSVVTKAAGDLENSTYWTTMSMPGKSGQATFDFKDLTLRSSFTGDRVPVLSSQIAFGDSLSFSLEGKANARGTYIPADEDSALKVGTLSWWFGAGDFPTKHTVTLKSESKTGDTVEYYNNMGDKITAKDVVEGSTFEINTDAGRDKFVEFLTDQNGNKFEPISKNKFMVTVGESLILTPSVKTDMIGSATFVKDGETTTLTWKELQESTNGQKFGYQANKITDTSIGEAAFGVVGGEDCGAIWYTYSPYLTHLTIPATITSIEYGICGGRGSWYEGPDDKYCKNLESVDIRSKYIGDGAFIYCENLETVILNDSIETIGTSAFYRTKVASIQLPKFLKQIGERAFGYSKLTSIQLPESLKRIEADAFVGLSLGDVIIPNGVEYLDGFSNANLTSIIIPSSVTELGDTAFTSCTFPDNYKLELPDSIHKYGTTTFLDCIVSPETTININSSVTSFTTVTFAFKNPIKSIYIPSSVTQIKEVYGWYADDVAPDGGGKYYGINAQTINCQPVEEPDGWIYYIGDPWSCGPPTAIWWHTGATINWNVAPPVNN